MRLSLFTILLAACGPIAERPLPRVETPECDGSDLHVCQAYTFVASSTMFATSPSCSTTPYRRDPLTRVVTWRERELEGCVDVGHPGPAMRCCP